MDYYQILTSMGYNLRDYGSEWRCTPIYRDSNNPNSLRIKKDNGRFVDFGISQGGSFEKLVQMTLGLKTLEEAQKRIGSPITGVAKEKPQPQEDLQKYFDRSFLDTLKKNHEYWEKRNINKETLEPFMGGLCFEKEMKGRYFFPIFDEHKRIHGLAGRDIYDSEQRPKWKLLGRKENWVFPLYLNENRISESRKVVLVEGIPDVLALRQIGLEECLCLFGVKLNSGLFNTLIRLNPKKIIISTNNEPDNASIGNKAAKEIKSKLVKFFDSDQIIIALPDKKDFAEQTQEENISWMKKINE